jgi:bacteriocin biosynthesis cyclodehydratase domain-containing protein
MLAAQFPGSWDVAPDALADAFAGDCDAVVIAASRPSWALCDRADQLAYSCQKPWLPIVSEHPFLRVGPMVCPPAGPCFACYRARRLQHDVQYKASAALDAAYDGDASLAPTGYLPHLVRFAVSVATEFLSCVRERSVPAGARDLGPGHVLTFDVLSAQVNVNRVVSCHGCDREQHPNAAAVPVDLARVAAQAGQSRGSVVRGSREMAVPR